MEGPGGEERRVATWRPMPDAEVVSGCGRVRWFGLREDIPPPVIRATFLDMVWVVGLETVGGAGWVWGRIEDGYLTSCVCGQFELNDKIYDCIYILWLVR